MAATFPAAPHPIPVFRVLKQAWRDYLAAGGVIVVNVTTPPNQTVAQGTTVAGTIEVDRNFGASMPAFATVELKQAGVVKGSQVVAVNPTTGAYSVQFVGGTLAAGAAAATVTSSGPTKAVTTPNFTVT